MGRLAARHLWVWLVVLVVSLLPSSARAQGPRPAISVPDALKPWVGWVTADDPTVACAPVLGDANHRLCVWPGRLTLALDDKGGRFTQAWHMDARGVVSLPGDDKRWPFDVHVDGARAAVVPSTGDPGHSGAGVVLEAGNHVITGIFAWDSLPESLVVPRATGLLELTLRGAAVPSPKRDAQGTVWLQKAAAPEEGERLDIVVHRHVLDEVPLRLTTRILLGVAGKSREVVLGKPLPAGFVPMTLDSPLPARLESDGHVRVQLRPGNWILELTARSEGPIAELPRPLPEGPWREGDEVWVVEPRTETRVATVGGATAIDPSQTSLPDEWKKFPAYSMKVGEIMTFAEKRRGDADPPPDQLSLDRKLWLDFDGAGYTVSDTVEGTLSRASRLETAAPMVLGRVASAGNNQFITRVGDPNVTGVEIREGTIHVTADSRIGGDVTDFPAVGWKHDFHHVTGTLHLPPGWRLLHATGVDEVPGTWLRHWSLFELFLALVTALAVARLYGVVWGAIAVVMLALTFPESDAPQWAWVFVVAFEAIVRVVPQGNVQRVARGLRLGALLVLVLVSIPFLIGHVRLGMYPGLATSGMAEDGVGRMMDYGAKSAPASAVMAEPMEAPPPPPPPMGGVAKDDDLREEAEAEEAPAPVQQQAIPLKKAASSALAPSKTRSYSNRQIAIDSYDPKAIVQTGPGLPRWTWTSLHLQWSGPVDAEQRIHLWLLSPAMNLFLAFLRAALLVAVVFRMLPWFDRFVPPGRGPFARSVAATLGLVLFAGALAFPRVAFAQTTYPPKEMLEELKKRVTIAPTCMPRCATTGRLSVDLRGARLRGRLELDAATTVAVPLPGDASQWMPDLVLVDGKPTAALQRTDDGRLYVALDEGAHQIVFEGAAPEGESFQVALPLKPHRVEVSVDGWTVDGVHEDGLADDALQFARLHKQDQGDGGTLQPTTLPPFLRVERTLRLGLEWRVSTRVVRVTPTGTAASLEVALLPGESVTTADVRVNGGKAQVALGPRASETSWDSILAPTSPIHLVASKSNAAVEVWRLEAGTMWHFTFAGIPPVHTTTTDNAGPRVPEWRPWPGETVDIEITRPEGVPGQTLTIDALTYDVQPGLRATDGTLTLSMRASRGLQQGITLPEGAELQSLTLDGRAQPVRQDGRVVTVPVSPGAQTAVISFRGPQTVSPMFNAPTLDLGLPAANTTTNVRGLGGRWILLAGGPRVGPVVLFWSLLLVLLVVAYALGRVPWVPLRTWEWMLLAIGLSQVPIPAAAVVVGWLLVVGWRGVRPEIPGGHALFDLRQIVLVLWTVGALVVLVYAVQEGLLGAPEMQIRGNGSSSDSLSWYQDRTASTLPEVWVVSVPMLVYRVAMLLWALWIARAVLAWLKWGYGAFTEGGAWRSAPRRRDPLPPIMPSMPVRVTTPGPPPPPPIVPQTPPHDDD